ncbi:IclR family transcriptional regulator [Klugiella xanthotipulae]|uniref:IclR family transcriptional regulator n=1 Tax=Klugiella xanthotipulae TaxID=244735 RepID=A0A543HTG4_9MICO|nr:IclR family transcriptional regulator [Klugiella xanthotipulae]TQM61564.1 IclR family transcriptional regulator [Klugiella xanthotipulae]
MANSSSGESMISRVVRVLDTLDAGRANMSITRIAAEAELPLATVHRLVRELMTFGWVERGTDGTVRLGLALWELANRGSVAQELRTAARPFMEDVHSVVKQHTQLGVLRGEEVVFVECYSRRGSVTNAVTLAGRLPVHSSSAGLAIMAFSEPLRREDYIRAHAERMPGIGNRLAQIRREGYAVIEGAQHVDTSGIAVPIAGRGGAVVAALSVVVPRDPAEVTLALPPLRVAAQGITRALRSRDYQSMERHVG